MLVEPTELEAIPTEPWIVGRFLTGFTSLGGLSSALSGRTGPATADLPLPSCRDPFRSLDLDHASATPVGGVPSAARTIVSFDPHAARTVSRDRSHIAARSKHAQDGREPEHGEYSCHQAEHVPSRVRGTSSRAGSRLRYIRPASRRATRRSRCESSPSWARRRTSPPHVFRHLCDHEHAQVLLMASDGESTHTITLSSSDRPSPPRHCGFAHPGAGPGARARHRGHIALWPCSAGPLGLSAQRCRDDRKNLRGRSVPQLSRGEGGRNPAALNR